MIGVIFTAYNVEPYVRESLEPFLREGFKVSAVSVPFRQYRNQRFYEDKTTEILKEYKEISVIDSPLYIDEHQARQFALNKLYDCDYIWLVDGDEIYSKENIDQIVEFISKEDSTCWFKLCLKNYVFNKSTYLEDPFVPPRIFKMFFNGYHSPEFYWDNDLCYSSLGSTAKVKYTNLPVKTVPQEVAWIDHYSWLNDGIGKRKVRYQEDRGWDCSFLWGENGLEFNPKFPIPKIIKERS